MATRFGRLPRFQRQVQRETGVVNPRAGQDMDALARELEAFSARRQDQLDEAAAEQSFEAGTVAGSEAGSGELPQSGGQSIRSRAFNRGAMVAHQAAVQTDIRDSVGRFAIQHPNDPAAFDAEVEGLSEGLLEAADPQMQAFIRQRVADYAGRAKLSIIEQQQAELRAEAAEDLQRGAEGFLGDARTAAFEGDVPLIEARRQELNQLLAEGVAGELIDEDDMLELRRQFEREVTQQEVVGHFDRLIREDLDEANPAIDRWQDTKPSDVGLSVEEHDAVTRQMVTLRNRRQAMMSDEASRNAAAERAERAQRERRVNDAISVLRDGFAPDEKQAEQVASDLAWLEDPELAADYDVANAIQGEVHRFRRMPSAARAAQLDDLEASLRTGGASADQVALLEALQKTHTEVDRELEADPRGYVNREGLVEDPALDFSSAQGLSQSIAARAEQTDIGRQLIGEPLPLLTAAEADQLAQVYQGAEIEERVGLLGVITAGAGEDAQATLAQLDAKGHQRMALLGGYVMAGQGLLAREIMRGEQVLAADSGIKPKRTDYQGTVDDVIGAALSEAPKLRAQYLEAAFAKYAELKARNGDLSDLYEPSLFEDALAAVLPTARFNGRRVAVPAGVSEDRFEDWTRSWRPADFEGVPGRDGEALLELVRDRARLVELGNGRYGVSLTSAASGRDKVLVQAPGEPFVLTFPMGQELR